MLVGSFPFGLMNCLLISLYFHETLHLASIKINMFITSKTKWIFYILCGIMLALLIFAAVSRVTVIFESVRVIVVIIYAVIGLGIAIFHTITAKELLENVKNIINKKASEDNLLIELSLLQYLYMSLL